MVVDEPNSRAPATFLVRSLGLVLRFNSCMQVLVPLSGEFWRKKVGASILYIHRNHGSFFCVDVWRN